MKWAAALLLVASPASAAYLSEGEPFLSILQSSSNETSCTAVSVSKDVLMTAARCLFEEDGTPKDVSVVPGFHGMDVRGPGFMKPRDREFPGRALVSGSIALFDLATHPKKKPLEDFLPFSKIDPQDLQGLEVQIFHYSKSPDLKADAQAFDSCAVIGTRGYDAALDCAFGSSSLGAPVISDGAVIGIIVETGDIAQRKPAQFRIAGSAQDRMKTAIESQSPDLIEMNPTPHAAVDVLNLCDQPVHQALFWLEKDGSTWSTLAKKIPAQSYERLPAWTIGSSVFSYARSDDNVYAWSGEDITVRVKDIPLNMVEIDVPRPTGDLTLVYKCESQNAGN